MRGVGCLFLCWAFGDASCKINRTSSHAFFLFNHLNGDVRGENNLIMRKTFRLFVTFVALFVTISTFTSCEDNGSGNTNPLVGKWQCKNHYNGGADYYTFTSDGQYTWDGPNDSWGTDFGKYAYNRELGTMTFTSLKGNHPGIQSNIIFILVFLKWLRDYFYITAFPCND